jgi:LacI family transcriptional regulator
MAKNVTIRDVARHARVSVGTVSRVINRRSDVSGSLRDQVERAMQELGYRPNMQAQSLSRQSSPILSFILSNRSFLHPLHSHVLQGVEEYCRRSGYFVLFAKFDYAGETKPADLQLPLLLERHRVADCMIVAGTNYDNYMEVLENLKIKYVLLANNMISAKPRPPVNQVRFDDVSGAVEATSYLIHLGHHDIWFIGDASTPWCLARYGGYLKAMKAAGLEPRSMTAGLSMDQFTDGYRSAEFVLDHDPEVSGIFCGTDAIAYGAWDALSARGKRVPSDISLIGFDDQMNALRAPQLTSVQVPAETVGMELARMAIERIQSGKSELPEIVIPTSLQRRGSCRPIMAGHEIAAHK